MLGFFGKHPAFGDFIGHGLSSERRDAAQDWLTECLATAKAQAGEAWSETFRAAAPVRFWIGASIPGGGLRGVFGPSQDKVGRNYPLVLAEVGGVPPILDVDQTFYARAEQWLSEALGKDVSDVTELAPNIVPTAVMAQEEPTFWAANPSPDVAELLTGVASTDMTRATAARSYWWVAGDGDRCASTVLCCEGALQPEGLLWLLRGISTTVLSAQTEDQE